MANAARKKAAIAQQKATNVYQPLLFVFDIVIVYMRIRNYDSYSASIFVGDTLCFGLSYWAYTSIVEEHAAGSFGKTGGNKKEALRGGDFLDLLAMIIVIQFGSIFSTKLWWGLSVVVAWVLYKLYSVFGTFMGMFRGKS